MIVGYYCCEAFIALVYCMNVYVLVRKAPLILFSLWVFDEVCVMATLSSGWSGSFSFFFLYLLWWVLTACNLGLWECVSDLSSQLRSSTLDHKHRIKRLQKSNTRYNRFKCQIDFREAVHFYELVN